MSKTAQRRRAAYDLGYKDGSTSHHFRYSHHPHMSDYQCGYREGQLSRGVLKHRTFWQLLLFALGFGRGRA